MRKTLLPMACAAFVALSASVLADDREDCSSVDVERIIRGCTDVINSRQELRQTLAIAYHRRGTAFASKKDYDRAITDYTKAIEIDPTYVAAYNDRGLIYTSKGDYERAVADVTKAVELTAKPTPQPKTIALTPPPAGETAKTEPSSTKTSAAIGKATAPAAAKPATLAATPPPSKPTKSSSIGAPKTSAIAKGAAPAPAKAIPKATPAPSEAAGEPPSWATQLLNNRVMN